MTMHQRLQILKRGTVVFLGGLLIATGCSKQEPSPNAQSSAPGSSSPPAKAVPAPATSSPAALMDAGKHAEARQAAEALKDDAKLGAEAREVLWKTPQTFSSELALKVSHIPPTGPYNPRTVGSTPGTVTLPVSRGWHVRPANTTFDASALVAEIKAKQIPGVAWPGAITSQTLKDLAAANPNLIHLYLIDGSALLDFKAIAVLTKLQDLYIYGAKQLTGLDALPSLPDLHSLHLNNCPALVNTSGVEKYTKLKALGLKACAVTELKQVQTLTALETLSLESTPVSSLSAVATLQNLTYIDVRNSRRLTDISALKALPKLETLILNGCRELGDVETLKSMKQLQRLEIYSCSKIKEQLDALKAALPDCEIAP